MKAKIKAGSPIWEAGIWPNIEYGDIDIVFDVKIFGSPDYALCYAPNFGLEPFGNGPIYVEIKYLEEESRDLLIYLDFMAMAKGASRTQSIISYCIHGWP